MQLLTKFKKILLGRVQIHLKFLEIYGVSEPYRQNIFELCQKLHVIMLIKS